MTLRGPFAAFILLLLFASLAGNFLVAGFVLARANGPAQTTDVERVVANAVRGFPPEIQRAIADTTKADRPALRARLDAVNKARQQMFEAMRAQPFNQAALDTAFVEYRQSTVALQKAGQDLVARAVADAPPDIRRKIKPPQGPPPPGGPGPGPRLPPA